MAPLLVQALRKRNTLAAAIPGELCRRWGRARQSFRSFAGIAAAIFDGHRQLADPPCDLIEMPRIRLGDDPRQPLQALFIAQHWPIVGNDRRRAPAAIDWDD